MKRAIFLTISLGLTLFAKDYMEPSQNPPRGLQPNQVPMFISIGWDDNSLSGVTGTRYPGDGMKWILDAVQDLKNPAGKGNPKTFDGSPVRCTFYTNGCYMYQSGFQGDYVTSVKWVHNYAYRNGHEIGNHTNLHQDGRTFSVGNWTKEIDDCQKWLTLPAPADADSNSISGGSAEEGVGVAPEDVVGFRTPFLFYNDNLFKALSQKGFAYDCSIEEGFQFDQDGTDFFWPYTLDHGSPGHDMHKQIGNVAMNGIEVTSHPGLWQMPAYAVVVPPDSLCEKYGVETGFRQRMTRYPGFDLQTGRVTGLDYNMWGYNKGQMNKAEFLATLKHTLHLRMQGNRAPFLFGAHTQYYFAYWNAANNEMDVENRKAAITEFIQYALDTYPEVRIVPTKDVLTWIKDPVALEGGVSIAKESNKSSFSYSLSNREISVTGVKSGTVTLHSINGKQMFEGALQKGKVMLPSALAQGAYITTVKTPLLQKSFPIQL